MKINLKAKNIELTPNIKDYIEKKIEMLKKYLGGLKAMNCDVEIEQFMKQNKGCIFRAEINLEVPGALLRVEKTEPDLFKAIDKAKDHMKIIIKKRKEKRQKR